MFLFENVKGLLNHDHGRTHQTILNIFEEVGYVTTRRVLNAWNYSVPQKRERLITIGIRKDLAEQTQFEFPKPHSYKPTLRNIKLDVNPTRDECAFYSEAKAKVFTLVPQGGWWKHIDPDVAKEYMKKSWDLTAGGGCTGFLRRIGLDEPCLSVMTSPNMKMTDRCHPLETRPFSYRENARIQTFPDNWEFCGNLTNKYKQIGNAVPVSLANEIGVTIRNILSENFFLTT